MDRSHSHARSRARKGWFAFGGLVLALTLVATGCSKKAATPGTGGSSGPSLSIAVPADGAKVTSPFTLKVDSSVPLGDPSTGDDHVHLCFDGASCDTGTYTLLYGDSIQIANLSNGTHTIEASLRHADHSAVGPTTTITVTVSGASGGSPTATSSPTGGGGYYG